MAKTATPTKKRQRAKSGLLTRVLILILLVGICAQLYTLRGQVERAQTDQELLAAQVDAQRQANEGGTALPPLEPAPVFSFRKGALGRHAENLWKEKQITIWSRRLGVFWKAR